MDKIKNAIGSIFFYLSVVAVFGIISLFMYFASCYWYAFLIPIIMAILLGLIRHTKYWRKFLRGVYCLLAIIISLTGLYFIRPPSNVSLPSIITRESIRTVTRIPKNRGDDLNNKLRDFIHNLSFWRAPKGYELTKIDIDGLPVEVLKKKDTSTENVILHLHGGGYLIQYTDIYRQMALKYSRVSGGADIVSLDYSVAPENVFPAALEDAQVAWDWMLEQGYKPENIIVVGDSAGGNLALALTAKLRDEGYSLPKALVLMSPWTGT